MLVLVKLERNEEAGLEVRPHVGETLLEAIHVKRPV